MPTFKLGLEVMTPTHIGSGELLQNNQDYFIAHKQQKVVIPEQKALYEALAYQIGPQKLTQFIQGGNHLETLTNKAELPAELKTIYTKTNQIANTGIREQIKTAYNTPYIPGSSLKGAIRTALIHTHKMHTDRAVTITGQKPKFADSAYLENVLGNSPQSNIMRALKVGDSLFTRNNLGCDNISIISQDQNGDKPKPFWITAESLQVSSFGAFEIQLDHELLNMNQQHGFLAHASDFQMPDTWDELKNRINTATQTFLKQETELLENRSKLTQAHQFAQELLTRMANDPEAAYIQIGFGIGWRGMTGDFLNNHEKKQACKIYKLGRPNFEFPKTRRINASGIPLGWVRIYPISKTKYEQYKQSIDQEIADWQQSYKENVISKQQAFEQAQRDKEAKEKAKREREERLAQMTHEQATIYHFEEKLKNDQGSRDGGMGSPLVQALYTLIDEAKNWSEAYKNQVRQLIGRTLNHAGVNQRKNKKAKALKKEL